MNVNKEKLEKEKEGRRVGKKRGGWWCTVV